MGRVSRRHPPLWAGEGLRPKKGLSATASDERSGKPALIGGWRHHHVPYPEAGFAYTLQDAGSSRKLSR
jgi:hypothetical protein